MGSIITAIWSTIIVSMLTIDDVRTNYPSMVNDKELCQKSITYLKTTANNSALHLGYLGGLETIWANHVFSPIAKLKTFSKGKDNIEKAIKMAPTNAELRFIRLSIQQNIPSFLGYNQHMKEDIEFLKTHRSAIESKVIQEYLDDLLKK